MRDGADELFGGYNRHKFVPLIYKVLSKCPLSIKYLLSKTIKNFPIKNIGLNQEKKQKLYRVLEKSSSLDLMYDALTSFSLDENPIIKNDLVCNNENSYTIEDSLTASEKIMLNDVLDYLPSDLLVKLDRSAMNVTRNSSSFSRP